MVIRQLCAFLRVSLFAMAPALFAQSVLLQPNSTTPLAPLTGESFQLYSNGTYFYDFTAGRTLSKYGLIGCDLGYPVVYSDKILILFGDTLSSYTDSGSGRFVVSPGSGGDDNISFIPNTDLSQCHYIGDVDSQLSRGNPAPSVDFGSCPVLQTYVNPNHGPTDHAYQATTIDGLSPQEGTGPYETPSGAFDYNGYLYMFYIVQIQNATPHFALESILAKSNQPSASFGPDNPPTFTKLFQVSSHPPITDPSNPPPEANNYGKFMFNPVSVLDHATLAANGLLSGLPPVLQTAEQVVFVFGSSWYYSRSNLYLAAFDIAKTEDGTSNWYYYAGENGSNQWTSDEKAAAPLLSPSPNISNYPYVSNHSVLWNSTLRRFVLMTGHILAAFSATPWGPWSNPVLVFDPNGDWAQKLIHLGDSPVTRLAPNVTVYTADGRPTDLNGGDTGFPYSPNQIDKPTVNSDGSVNIYYTMSTWNPYEVLLMKSTFAVGPLPGPVVSGASYDSSAIAPASIASIFGPGLADALYPTPTAQLGTTLGGRQVFFTDSAGKSYFADLYFVGPKQINFVVPPGAPPGPATVSVLAGSNLIFSATTQIQAVTPALFTANANGSGVASAYLVTKDANNQNHVQAVFTCTGGAGSCVPNRLDLNQAQNGAFLELYGTGIRNNFGLGSVSVSVGNYAGTVLYAGPQKQYEGMDQVNVLLPLALQGAGQVNVNLLVNGLPANTVTIAFQ